jgi:hypothetical protein
MAAELIETAFTTRQRVRRANRIGGPSIVPTRV